MKAPRPYSHWLVAIVLLFVTARAAFCADAFDALRQKWLVHLTGGTNYDPGDPELQGYLQKITGNANTQWSTMLTAANRTTLWADLPNASRSTEMTASYNRIYDMALGYATWGGTLYTNEALAAGILDALDWMYANRYNEKKSASDNWWDWEIGTPMALNDITTLMFDRLSSTRFNNYMNAVNKFTPSPAKTGANLVWKTRVCAIRGVLVKDAAKLTSSRSAYSKVFPYVTSGDGFYVDGSFIQHEKHPYTGGYGASLVASLTPIMRLLQGSTWEITDAKKSNVVNWAFNSYFPVITRGAMMDMVRGREVSRIQGGRAVGHNVMGALFELSEYAPAADGALMKSLLKYEAEQDPAGDWTTLGSLNTFVRFRQMLADTNVVPPGERVFHKQFPSMDSVVHSRSDFALGIRMSSARIYNYEVVNNENIHGWFTGDGMTYLFNQDLDQFTDNFWPTVNPYRLPGTTVDTATRANASGQSTTSGKKWVGGADLDGVYGAVGMELKAYGSTLTGRKSWFCFDDEIVCLGTTIAGGTKPIETIVENRMIDGSEEFTANGNIMPGDLGWSNNLAALSWCALDGVGGYFFPSPVTAKAIRETRTGSWRDINQNRGPTNSITRNYLTLWLDHGVKPANASYSYVLLPNKNAADVAAYAANPHVAILENSATAQAVLETNLNLLAVNFWGTSAKTVSYITSSSQASVLARETTDRVSVGVSDPTQAGKTLTITLNRKAVGLVSADAGISVKRLTPTIQFTVNVSKMAGRTFHAVFAYTTNAPISPLPLVTTTEEPADPEISTVPPQLAIATTDNGLVLSWAADGRSFNLYSTDNLALSMKWSPVNIPPTWVEGEWQVIIPPSDTFQRFYRLK